MVALFSSLRKLCADFYSGCSNHTNSESRWAPLSPSSPVLVGIGFIHGSHTDKNRNFKVVLAAFPGYPSMFKASRRIR